MCQTGHMGNDPDMKFLTDYLLSTGHDILAGQGYAMDRYELYVSGLWGRKSRGMAAPMCMCISIVNFAAGSF